MRRIVLRCAIVCEALLALVPAGVPQPAHAADESRAPKGEVLQFSFSGSKIFPGTVRDYWVYVPRQYDPVKPACVYIKQYDAPEVFDQLIHKKEIPILIGVFVRPGVVKAISKQALDRFNRSYEYDGPGPNYARFLLEELLPDVEKKITSDGRPIRLSRTGNDRCISGSSSGATCAFTTAWERPNDFRRVFSSIGTYDGLRGGNVYPTLIRKVEPEPNPGPTGTSQSKVWHISPNGKRRKSTAVSNWPTASHCHRINRCCTSPIRGRAGSTAIRFRRTVR